MGLSAEARRRILESGALAPSGDNLQPWTVEWRNDTLHLSVDPARDRSLYNVRQHASLIALGAMVENLTIGAREFGATALVECMAEGDLISARLAFQQAGAPADPLFPFVSRRCTNRKPYQTTPIAPAALASLRGAIPPDGAAELRFIEDRGQRRALARAASLNDRLLFESRTLHDQFFEAVRWTAEEAERSRDGLFVKTLELGPMSAGFKAMRSWNVANVVSKLGGTYLAPGHSFNTFMRSGAFGFLQMKQTTPQAYLDGGRALQRIWLTATSLGLSFQPMAGMLYLLAYGSSGEPGPAPGAFRGGQHGLLVKARGLFEQVLPLDDRKAAIMLFRLGYGPPPSATSLRRPLGNSSLP